VEGPPIDIIILQNPPSSKDFLPGFSGLKLFAPPIARLKVPCYVSPKFLRLFSVLTFFPSEAEDFMALDVYTPKRCFGSSFPRFRIGNVYAGPHDLPLGSLSPETSLINFDFLSLVAGDFNIQNPALYPFRVLSSNEESEAAPYLN